MRILVAYYTRTGCTRKAAEAVAEALRAVPYEVELEEIVEKKSRDGALGWIGARTDATLKRDVEIEPVAADVGSFDLVIAGTPVWAWTVTPPVRTFLASNVDRIRQAAFFCTVSGPGATRAFEEMEEALDLTALATVALLERHVKKEDEYEFLGKVEEFVGDVVRAVGRGGTAARPRPGGAREPVDEAGPDANALTFETSALLLERFDLFRGAVLRGVELVYGSSSRSARFLIEAREAVSEDEEEEGRSVDVTLTVHGVKEFRVSEPPEEDADEEDATPDIVLSAGLRMGFMEERGEEIVFLDLRPRSESSETLNDFMQSGFMVAGARCTWVAAPRAAET
jgi:menaquinone-dependent protoporphyrinogen IX oxidase